MTNIFHKKEIPLVFAVDDNYAPFLCVTLRSIMANASSAYYYKVYVLNTELSDRSRKCISEISEEMSDDVSVEYVDVASRMDEIKDKTFLRDYYTNTTYYRIFIPSLFPQYDKIIYLDCDLVFLEDVSKLYNVELKNEIFAAVHEEAMSHFDIFGLYAENFLGVDRMKYFNAGILVINANEYRKADVENKFIDLMTKHKFRVAQDQDYLNVVCKDRVKYLDVGWNKTPIPDMEYDDDRVKVIHYKLNFKPWRYDDVRYQDAFWKYAKDTSYYSELLKMRDDYGEAAKKRDAKAFSDLLKMAGEETAGCRNYLRLIKTGAI